MDTNAVYTNFIDNVPVEVIVDEQPVPILVNWATDGTPISARDLVQRQRIDPAQCDHAGCCYSSSLALNCPKCGIPLFIPPRLLGYLPASVVTAMHELWIAAGWPAWQGHHWSILAERWTMIEHPLFVHCCGIPVRNDRRDLFERTLEEFDL